jgi:predicted metal-binding protein
MFVCQSCAGKWQDGKQVGPSGGSLLYTELVNSLAKDELVNELEIRGVNCLGACGRPCAIALAAPGKSTYLFGDLSPTDSLAEVSVSILECTRLYLSKPDGVMKWTERPERLKKGLIGTIPSLDTPAIVN